MLVIVPRSADSYSTGFLSDDHVCLGAQINQQLPAGSRPPIARLTLKDIVWPLPLAWHDRFTFTFSHFPTFLALLDPLTKALTLFLCAHPQSIRPSPVFQFCQRSLIRQLR